ncbi:phosphate propanoyltransferase [Pragia fontium]|uniref:Phosphate propanoyltransferase n=1 Tax=Pragia fontium TaxID=82985 RepID=A0ABQ5LGB8_9GAMM|nr:phosphate propanoyltransferase [Pragia fontium]AKJ42540.1 phosphate propanoyltransferase [Pragia fontium]GKX62630.1 phosphate propanoyltransferase [Pragia fontium]SUB82864.1 Phosphate propanoyltransferase [Pragia fontium]VEJ55764.1 Phosphate propanoyltransferase [Pragia fontium]
MINQSLLAKIHQKLPGFTANVNSASASIPIGVSNRHVHLSAGDIEALFGPGYQLTPFKELKQPGQYAAKECVMIVGPKGNITNVRVLGPARDKTQLEISKADCFVLGVKAPVRESGDLPDSADALLVGPAGHVHLKSQVICAQRHIHMNERDAQMLNVTNGQTVRVKTAGQRSLIFDEVVVRVKPSFALEFHIDTDEANAAGLKSNDSVFIVA